MFEVRYATEAEGREGILRIAGGIWSGDACVLEFADSATGIAGSATCDWRRPAPWLDVVEGDATAPAAQALLGRIAELLAPFHRDAFADVTDEALQRLYAGAYHSEQNYATRSATETAFKRHVLDQALALCAPRKVLDAGCSAGEVVRQLRERGIEAWGFDVCPDLPRVAYPEVAPWLRQGRVDAVPFGPEDGFDTLLALDVFEHVPERCVPGMVAEFVRLGVQRLIAHIALVEFQYPGHITLRPLSWWDRQLAPWFRRTTPTGHAAVTGAFGADPSRFLRVYELVAVPAQLPEALVQR